MRRFCTGYAKVAASNAMSRTLFLRLGERAAARMAVEYGDRLWEIKIDYDERFSRCSPGILLTHETLRWTCERHLISHEFLGTAEPWQRC
jgi:CelD/BcsL family acetyltransferase involved in cellulose biosynthesis